MAWSLCSREDVINIHPCQESDLPDQWSDMVEDLIKDHMRIEHLGTTATITAETHSGDGTTVLQVRKPPIVSVSEIVVNGGILDASTYVVFETYVQLKLGTFVRGQANITITYVSGVAQVPPKVRLCAASMIVAMLNYYRTRGADSSIKYATPDRVLGDETPNRNVGLTSHLQAIMKRTLSRSLKFK